MTEQTRSRPPAAALVGYLSYVLIGWSGLLVPSLIRSVKDTFEQTDAGIGVFYFVYAVLYAAGSLGGGLLTERLGRRTVLGSGAILHGVGLIAIALAPTWPVMLVAAIPAGLGVGILDGGGNGLFLDLYPSGRGRALNTLHLFFSVGALSAPLAVGRLVEAGVRWEAIVASTGVAALSSPRSSSSCGCPMVVTDESRPGRRSSPDHRRRAGDSSRP